MAKQTYFNESLLKYTQDDFVALVENRFGWAVAEQAKDILQGQAFEEQNIEALKYIKSFAQTKGEHDLAESIGDYIKKWQKEATE